MSAAEHILPLPPLLCRIRIPSAAAMDDLARAFCAHLGAGDVLALSGPLGAGKTHFARALIGAKLAEQGLREDIPSPSFTLVQTYEAGALEIWHADLYRLSDPFEMAELGLDEAMTRALCLIEWPERMAHWPISAIWLRFVPDAEDADARHLSLHGHATAALGASLCKICEAV